MKTDCKSNRIEIQDLGRRQVVGEFNGGDITSDAGGILLREINRKLNLTGRIAECFEDYRNPDKIEHTVEQLVAQRIFGIALGYEDLNDHDDLRGDPLLALLCEKPDPTGQDRVCERDKGKALAGKSTLNRLELSKPDANVKTAYKKIVHRPELMDDLLVDVFMECHRTAPEQIVLDLDATDDPLHGSQEGRFFHGYYKSYCYLPLYIFCGDHLLCARLRPSNIDASKGSVEELDKIVGRIRKSWKATRIVIRGDSGFCREEIMKWCEENHVDYILGLGKNPRLTAEVKEELVDAHIMYCKTGRPSRIFHEFEYKTRESWSRSRRVIAKAEHLAKGANPRFVVTSISSEEKEADEMYEKWYCARGDMENRIKEQQLYMFADRTSTTRMRSNQLRLYFSSMAYTLVNALRVFGLRGTKMEKAQCGTIRVKLMKIGARIRVTVRKVWISLASSFPHRELFFQIFEKIRNLNMASV
jgi:hypothetical protein